jgi:hypothetical protein
LAILVVFFSRKMTGWWFWLNIIEHHKMNIGYLEELYSVNLCNKEVFWSKCTTGKSNALQALGLGVVHKWPHSMPGPQNAMGNLFWNHWGMVMIFRIRMIRSYKILETSWNLRRLGSSLEDFGRHGFVWK